MAHRFFDLAEDIQRQATADKKRGRPQLAGQLEKCAAALYQAREDMSAAWTICEPYMHPEPPSHSPPEEILDSDGQNYQVDDKS
ncbi:hypothetical protein FJZ18_00305 [Candidatus Pacearchaeota archaeon]|nr:hypothetical protein [Candidatus Pacearchaeota archaeon]